MFNPKGKNKVNDDPWDINPEITYRHILSKVPAIFNPLRVIALVDNDAFYASAERVRLGLSDDIPLAVQQWQALIAVSYKAREYGISRMGTVVEAKKKCPELVAVHTATYREGDIEPAYHENPDVNTHKVSLDYYRRESKKIVEIYRELLPLGGEIEKASIDECFFDLTTPIRNILIERYPQLNSVPPDSPLGIDTPLPSPRDVAVNWTNLGNIIPVLKSDPLPPPTPGATNTVETEAAEGEEAVAPEVLDDQHQATWGDVALSIGAELIMKMRMEVKNRLGYTTSGGIARNKVLAKLVASYKKRDTQSVLRNAALPGYWRPMPFQKIRFLGGKLGENLSSAFQVRTVGELEYLTLEDMQRRFGEESIWIWNILRGVDYSELSEEVANKSMLSSKNIRPPVTKVEDGDRWLRMLAGDLALRLLETREISPSMWPKTISVGVVRDGEPRQSRQGPFPYTRNFSVDTILPLAQKLWRELTAGKHLHLKVHNISLSFHGLTAVGAGQKRIENFLGSSSDADSGNRKRGREDEPGSDALGSGVSTSFVCERCSKRIALPPSALALSTTGDCNDGVVLDHLLQSLKNEHADYHFARDLSRQVSDDEDVVETVSRPSSKKKKSNSNGSKPMKRKEPKGIAKYFAAGPSTVKGK